MKQKILYTFFLALIFTLIAIQTEALDYPHNVINNIGCDACHYVYGDEPDHLPEWTNHVPQDIDDTQYNDLCWSCHNDIRAPYMMTHSSLQTDNSHGDWTIECRTCHNLHTQKQLSNSSYRPDVYLTSGASTGLTTTTLTKAGAGWEVDAYEGLVLIPYVTSATKRKYGYKITGNTSDTITVKGPIDLTKVSVGKTFAVIYGKLIKDSIVLDNIIGADLPKSGSKTVKFFNSSGQDNAPISNSFADGDLVYDGICEVCHTGTTHFRNDGTGSDPLHTNMNSPAGTNCIVCHTHLNGFRAMGGGAHPTHVTNTVGPQLSCTPCHGSYTPPLLADGQNLENTTVCNNCHSSAGAVTAKTYWDNDPGTWVDTDDQAGYCGGCHDSTPANTKQDGTGDTTVDILGNNTTYGFFVTGHGKTTGNYANLSWQASSASGNPAANKACDACHDLTTEHYNSGTKRLKSGYEDDIDNSNCKQCHDPGTVAVGDPQWYTTYTAFENSAHKAKKCSDCHDVHGVSGAYPGMTTKNQEDLCYDCHTDGVVQNNAVSGSGLSDDIEHAFTLGNKHDLETAFSISSNNYSLECVSCHNVHIITGKYWEADQDKSPVTLFSDNTSVWGDDWNEKMDFYVGGGTYRTPTGDTYSGDQLPDYDTFCLDCHAAAGAAPFGLDWVGRPHGKQSANSPNGYGTCPNWFGCGKADGWDGDDCVGGDDCWPVITRGKGDQIWSRAPYNHEERIAGANFTLSCTDCHEAHGSNVNSMIRSNVNNGTGTTIWNTMCNNCHYYYSDWHAGMSCGTASCHVTNSIHRASNMSGSGATRTFDPDLVFNYKFENNLKDSGTGQMDGKWFDVAGSYTSGKSGQAAVMGEDIGVQIGTENASWANDEGAHGTWKYMMMKYNTSLEAWVYPTEIVKSDYTIFNMHTGVNNGGYTFTLTQVNGTLRAAFKSQIDNNEGTQDGMAGLRGAYSSIAIPLNMWTHVAVTFDQSGPDRDVNDTSVGRIRIYVNGEDVTTSDPSGNYMQPGSSETSMYSFAENNGWNQTGVCYLDSWCAFDSSIGGFSWESSNFIGRIDEAKLWNVTKNASYFSSYDSQAGPYISSAEGIIGSDQLTVTLSEGVYANAGEIGALTAADFTFIDTDNSRTITGVSHTAGNSTATLTLSAALDDTNDFDVDMLAPASSAIYDDYDVTATTASVAIKMDSSCPDAPVTFNLNEAPGSSYAFDSQNRMPGSVNGAGTLTGGYFSGDGSSGGYINFTNNTSCLQADTAMSIEMRIKPTGIPNDTTTNYISRILARDGGGNYQVSLWRNQGWATYGAPAGETSVALWTYVDDNHGGNSWKLVLSNYTGGATGGENECGIVNDHWYLVKVVWDTNKPGGTPGQFFQPADIYIDDKGTDGAGAGENWVGYINCTDTDQSLKADNQKYYTGDTIRKNNSSFAIGINRANLSGNQFNGLIDWITWKDSVD